MGTRAEDEPTRLGSRRRPRRARALGAEAGPRCACDDLSAVLPSVSRRRAGRRCHICRRCDRPIWLRPRQLVGHHSASRLTTEGPFINHIGGYQESMLQQRSTRLETTSIIPETLCYCRHRRVRVPKKRHVIVSEKEDSDHSGGTDDGVGSRPQCGGSLGRRTLGDPR